MNSSNLFCVVISAKLGIIYFLSFIFFFIQHKTKNNILAFFVFCLLIKNIDWNRFNQTKIYFRLKAEVAHHRSLYFLTNAD